MAKKKINKGQYRYHHTPESYYKNFIPKGSNVFTVYDIQTGRTWTDNGRNTGYEPDLHDVGRMESLPDGRTVNRLEAFFSWSESQTGPVYKRWIAEERIRSREDVALMCAHLVILFLRNPKQLQMMTDIKINFTFNKLKKMLEKADASVLRRFLPESNPLISMTDVELCAHFLEIQDQFAILLDKKDALWEGLDPIRFS
jgi:Protein of unknown function (DUF4238)